MFERTKQLIGDKFYKLQKSKVIIFGIGGVGGYTAEMLVRSGVGSITLVDFDTVSVSNKNRQIIALNSTIGKYKVDVMKDRLLDINPDVEINSLILKLTIDNIADFNLCEYDYIIDAIDMVSSKVALIEYAYNNHLNIVSAMGAGNRMCIPEFDVADIYSTYNDGLSKVLRRELRKRNIMSHKVVYTKNIATPTGDTIGSIAYYPAMCGCVLSAFVINELIK